MTVVKWENISLTGETCAPFECPHYADKSIQVIGTFDGATITIQGSNMIDSPTYSTLNDAEGDALEFSSAGIKQILENSYWVRPSISGAGATTDIDVYMLIHANR